MTTSWSLRLCSGRGPGRQTFGALRAREEKCARLGYESDGDDSHLEFHGELSSSAFTYLSLPGVHVCMSYTFEDMFDLIGV